MKMRHIKSNTNIFKPKSAKVYQNSNSNNNFKKVSSILQISHQKLDSKTISNNFRQAYDSQTQFSSIMTKDIKTSKSQNKINNFNRKNKTFKPNYSTSTNTIFHSNSNNSNSANRGINIRVNFKNKIINNNFEKRNKFSKSKNRNSQKCYKNMNNNNKMEFNINERIKEKDKQITLLQKNLLQSQKLLNLLQEEKQKEISSTYNTIKHVDSYNNYNTNMNSNQKTIGQYYSLNNIFSIKTEKNLRMLRTVYGKKRLISNNSNRSKTLKNASKIKKKQNLNLYINTTAFTKYNFFNNNVFNNNKYCKTRNNIKKKNYNFINLNSGQNSNTNKKKKDLSLLKFMQVFTNSPNKVLTNYIHFRDINPRTAKNASKKNIQNINFGSPSIKQNQSQNKKMKEKEDKNFKDLSYIIQKGEELKKRMQTLLDNYIELTYKISNSKNNKKSE